MQQRGSGSVSAAIVTYQPDLERLELVLEAAAGQTSRVIVIDNGSTDLASLHALVARHAGAELIELGENRGIAAALNVARDRLSSASAWTLTLDQDTIISEGSVMEALEAFGRLDESERQRCGILAMTQYVPPATTWRRRYIEQGMTIRELGELRERRYVITSGNMVRSDVFASIAYNEPFFIDAVDTLYSIEVRRAGWTILQLVRPTMDHSIGRRVVVKGTEKTYEPPLRIYYVTRNQLYLVVRRQLRIRIFLRSVIGLSRVVARVDGPVGAFKCLCAVLLGIFDALAGRFGRRQYRLLYPSSG